MNKNNYEFVTGKEFREIMKISQATLNRWVKSGRLKAIRLNPENPYSELRVPVSEIERLMNENGSEQ